ncbi:MAG TPA: hypothetical protein VFJ98_06580 [Mycobacteriales bacterium]|nr:hypothetical protein [Mycobacteriales bacterium]
MSPQPIGQELVLANDHVRVWLDVVAPGEEQPVHTHEAPYLSVMLTPARAQVVDGTGTVLYDVDRSPGDATWFGPERVPVTHTLRNVGDAEIRVAIVEVLKGDQP